MKDIKYNPETGEFESSKDAAKRPAREIPPTHTSQPVTSIDRTPMRTIHKHSSKGTVIAIFILIAILFIICICIGTPTANRLGGVFGIVLIIGTFIASIIYSS